ncbi:MAG: hypothetical protein A3G81_25955 [Betaproteobacteria bacterium RIFCSPLOWO2_12_FULL_65_14]|nr:MAG: hypothetical protein A3G81_25955 [Betaproteobacteria bacterium RIFCSPLOWO2_12_FULL_65_14]
MPSTVHARALARAAEILGGVAALSEFLQVPYEELTRWIKGEVHPTTQAFHDVVELLLQADSELATKPTGDAPGPS